MGFGPFSSSSSASDSQINAGDNANIVRGKGTITEAGGLSLGAKSSYNLGTSLSKSKVNSGLINKGKLNTGNQIKAAKGSTVVVNDTAPLLASQESSNSALASLGSAFADTVKQITTTSTAALKDTINSSVDSGTSSLSSLAPDDTGTAPAPAPAPKTKYWIIGAAVLLVLFFILRRR